MYRIILFSIVVCLALPNMAQVSIGHRVGVVWSKWKVTGSDPERVENWNSDKTFLPGIAMEIPVEIEMFGRGRLNTGICFVQKGFQNDRGYKDIYRINYIQLPLSVGWAFPIRKFSIVPSIGGLLGLSARGYHQTRSSFPLATIDRYAIGRFDEDGFSDRIPDKEFALLARLNVGYRWDHGSVALDLSYQHGISDVMFNQVHTDLNGNEIGSPVRYEAMQRSFGIQLGYQLALGRGRKAPIPAVLPNDSLGTVPPLERTDAKLMLGTRFGATSSTMDFTADLPLEQTRVVDGAEALMGISVGLVARIRFGRHWSLQPELAYMQKGWRCQWYPRPTVQNDLLRMNYVELAPLAHYAIGKGRVKPFVFGGAVVGRGVGGVQLYRADYALFNPTNVAVAVEFGDDARSGEYEQWDLSAQFGAGVGIPIGRSELFLDVRYQHSVTDFVNDWNTSLYSEDVEAYHRNWMVNVGYLVPWR